MEKRFAEIGADGADPDAVSEGIRRKVSEKEALGAYDDWQRDRNAFLEIKELRDDAELLGHLVKRMRKSCEIDINDFRIVSKGGPFGPLEVILKKTIWKLLKFYTYRMFMQQRAFNVQVVTALNSIWSRLRDLEQRIDNAE